ncbi:MAG: DUF2283 domain-containing protein [Ignavibacteriae bacterium]|nr:DUF2283 domain-containing protein [Ignavibacteriota bacterium]MCB9244096.1 DUF2283 domain-containing protein [Ignavibacteriales bacterium]
MKITLDEEHNVGYIYFKEGEKVDKSIELGNSLVIDFSKEGKIIGLELLDAKEQLDYKAESYHLVFENLFKNLIKEFKF